MSASKHPILRVGTPNANGVTFSRESVEAAIESAEYPVMCSILPKMSISVEEMSHKVVDMELVGDYVYATISLLDTPSGRIARDLVETGAKFAAFTVGSFDDRPSFCVKTISTFLTSGDLAFSLPERERERERRK